MRRVTRAERIELLIAELEMLKLQNSVLQKRVRVLEVAGELRLHALEIAVARFSQSAADLPSEPVAYRPCRVVDPAGRVIVLSRGAA